MLVAVEALWEVHLDRGERPADAIWRAAASEAPGRTPAAARGPSQALGPARQRDGQPGATPPGPHTRTALCSMGPRVHRSPRPPEVAPTHRTRWPGGTTPAPSRGSKRGAAPPGACRTGSRKAAGLGSTGPPRPRRLGARERGWGYGGQGCPGGARVSSPPRGPATPLGRATAGQAGGRLPASRPFMYSLEVSTISWYTTKSGSSLKRTELGWMNTGSSRRGVCRERGGAG